MAVLNHNQLLRSHSRNKHANHEVRSASKFTKWRFVIFFCTLLIPNFALYLFGMRDKNVQKAWREKVTLCILIFLACFLLAFFTYGMNTIVCKGDDKFVFGRLHRAKFNKPIVLAKGGLYVVEENHKEFDVLASLEKQNITSAFKINSQACKRCFGGPISDYGEPETNLKLKNDKNLTRISTIHYTWSDIMDLKYLVIENKVYDPSLCTEMLYQDLITYGTGTDITNRIDTFKLSKDELLCFKESFLAGEVSSKSYGCLVADVFLYLTTLAIFGLIITRFVLAVFYSWHMKRKTRRLAQSPTPHVGTLLLLTCYSETKDGLIKSLDSLCEQHYPSTHKLIVVIADGMVMGEDSEKLTPDILRDIIYEDTTFDQDPKTYPSLGAGDKRNNRACVRIGKYEASSSKTQCKILLILKVGNPMEPGAKPGNRGKRDSQVILMGFFQRILYKERICSLDYDIYRKIKYLTPDVLPEQYQIVMMIDADTIVSPTALGYIVREFENDKKIMGICGETKIINKTASWVTMIQVFEYYVSHHLSKSFESVFGGVTCLPGCFCSYRISISVNTEDPNDFLPILANPVILKDYSISNAETLHDKNLLFLGEDRYLTTLLLKNFYKRKLIFLPAALCQTYVPDSFPVLLSQRRRWINSTIHNLFELVRVQELCGTFCFSMRFVVGMELIGTLVLPAAILFTGVLLAVAFVFEAAWIPLIMLMAILGLPAVLIFLTTFEISYLVWIVIYIVSLPIWNLLLPMYSFWHFDDFSWGDTRKIEQVDSKFEMVDDGEGMVFKELDDWNKESLEKSKSKK